MPGGGRYGKLGHGSEDKATTPQIVDTLQATQRLQHRQRAACNVRYAACNVQHATCNVQHAHHTGVKSACARTHIHMRMPCRAALHDCDTTTRKTGCTDDAPHCCTCDQRRGVQFAVVTAGQGRRASLVRWLPYGCDHIGRTTCTKQLPTTLRRSPMRKTTSVLRISCGVADFARCGPNRVGRHTCAGARARTCAEPFYVPCLCNARVKDAIVRARMRVR